MDFLVTLQKHAEWDIAEQFEFYEEKRSGLGHDFLLCVEEALDKIQRNPLIYREIYKGLRRCPVRRFPYRLFYLVRESSVIVTAVFHVRKDPTSWEGRV